jgi:hypothetical protein
MVSHDIAQSGTITLWSTFGSKAMLSKTMPWEDFLLTQNQKSALESRLGTSQKKIQWHFLPIGMHVTLQSAHNAVGFGSP